MLSLCRVYRATVLKTQIPAGTDNWWTPCTGPARPSGLRQPLNVADIWNPSSCARHSSAAGRVECPLLCCQLCSPQTAGLVGVKELLFYLELETKTISWQSCQSCKGYAATVKLNSLMNFQVQSTNSSWLWNRILHRKAFFKCQVQSCITTWTEGENADNMEHMDKVLEDNDSLKTR